MDDIDEFVSRVINRFTAEELVDALGLTVEDIIDRFFDELIFAHGESIFEYHS